MKNAGLLLSILVFGWLCLVIAGCKPTKSRIVWDRDFPVIGSQSSPRAADLNGDGVLDIVIGAGKNEFQPSVQGVLAIDGKTGEVLWQKSATDQVYGSATFCDVTGDQVPEVFIGGRSPHFWALNGKTGTVVWEFEHEKYKDNAVMKYARFNFNNSVLIPDQNGDGISDILTVNGGNATAAPHTEKDRFPGVLILFDAKTGAILKADTMPDGKESYMAPVCFAKPGSRDLTIIYGTGGETIDGHLYRITVADFIADGLRSSQIIASEIGHGFIAPPVLADLTGDGTPEVIAISHGSQVVALDGNDFHLIWQRTIPNTESSNSFAVGNFTGDAVPDFFTFVSKGKWPNSTGSLQVLLDGKDGHIAFADSIGCTGFSSPVVYDLDDDGIDEAIISVNEYDCQVGYSGKVPPRMQNRLIAFQFRRGEMIAIDQLAGFKNIFSTPWIGDMDDDGYLDIVHCQYYNSTAGELLMFLGMKVKRIATPIRMSKPVIWGAYRGSAGDGLYPVNQ
ncbi:MAG TPA: FG-GAP-like repeat-containing protein [Cyclobacteriaceae bacterium]|nr:FG-GAP-like repeat-containing protein [Cyclobacteriaceae bacterium]